MTKKLLQLLIGLLLYGIGIYMTIQANLGVAPWDAFHQGFANKTGLTFGQASIVIGVLIVFVNIGFKEKIGLGTLTNTVLIGMIIDLLYTINLIPAADNVLFGLVLLFTGMVIIALATYFYIDAAFGAGPRDGLMIILAKLSRKPIGLVRLAIESSVCIIGYLLGGQIGIGTVVIALGIGPIVQTVFKLLKFKIEAVQHKYLFS